MLQSPLPQVLVGLLGIGLAACSQSNGSPGPSGAGGGTRMDGTGGTVSAGGIIGSGGVWGSGGGANGGAVGMGGSRPGGATAGGGTPAGNGGAPASGGTAALGVGGSIGTGGASGQGGAMGAGGSTANGADAGRDASPGAGGTVAGDAATAGTGGAGGGTTVTCPGGAKPSDGKRTVMVGTTSRTYYLHIPTAYDGSKPAPLVVDFHGLGGNGTSEATSNPYRPVIDPEGVVSAYPDGASGTNGTGWNLGPCCTSTDDVAFAKALVQDVEKAACIDPKRVYAVGYSLGGGMVHVLACKAADVFAAASPAAADLVQQNVDSCVPARPITVFTFRGTADTAVPYGGGSISGLTNIGALATFQQWAKIDQCTGSPSASDSNGCSTYSSCGGGVQVTLCTKQGGGHDPGTATVSWPVLKKYTLP